MSYVSLGSALTTILESISDINAVYNHEPKELKDYPAVTVTALRHQDTFSDTAANKRVFTFNIRVYFRTDVEQDAESVLRGIVDQIISAIESNVTLSGACDFARPTEAVWDYQERELPVRVAVLSVECVKRINR